MIIFKNIIFSILNLDAQIDYKCSIGNYIRLPHSAMGIVISHKAIIHDHVTIFHQVTIGVNESKPIKDQNIIIENNCYLSAGCKIISCRIGQGSKIAPNAVVYKDVPPESLCFSVNNIKTLKKNK